MHTLVQGGLLANRQFTDWSPSTHCKRGFDFLYETFNLGVMSLRFPERHEGGKLWPTHSPDSNSCDFFLWGFLKEKVFQRGPENVAQLRAHIMKLCRALSEDLCRKVVTNARVRLQEVVRQNGGHIDMFFIRNNFPAYED